jgi:hypothetical protein
MDAGVDRYEKSHQNPINRVFHTFGIPMIAVSISLFLIAPLVRGFWKIPLKEAKIDLVTSQAADWETDKANQATSAIITQNPDISAILACNDSMPLGAGSTLYAVKTA